nr:zinc finger, CCHC-type, retrotransposon Gag domain protein [Tanacetum cinerariifolium]
AKGGEAYVATLSWKDFHEAFFLQYFPRSAQQKYEREYHTIRQKDGELTGEFIKRFLRFYQQNRDQQYNHSYGSSRQKKYIDYTSPPPCDTCGKLHPGKECYRV